MNHINEGVLRNKDYDTWQKCVRLANDASTTAHERAAALAKANELRRKLDASAAEMNTRSAAEVSALASDRPLTALSDDELRVRLKALELKRRHTPRGDFSNRNDFDHFLWFALRDVRSEIRHRKAKVDRVPFSKMSNAQLLAWKPVTKTKTAEIKAAETELRARIGGMSGIEFWQCVLQGKLARENRR